MTHEIALTKVKVPITEGPWKKMLTDWAKQYGYKKIGSGFFGMVFINPKRPNEIIKVFSDKAYYRWVQLCRKRLRGNPYVPIFKSLPVKIPDSNLWFVRLEKLTQNTVYRTTVLLSKYIYTVLSDNYGVESVYTKSWLFGKRDITKKRAPFDKDEALQEVTQELGMYLTLYSNQLHFTPDLHMNNFMMRGNQLVIIDPIGDVKSLPRAKDILDKPMFPDTEISSDYQSALTIKLNLEKDVKDASEELQSFAKGKMGLTPDDVKSSPKYKKAHQKYVQSMNLLRQYNSHFLKKYKSEYQRDSRKRK